MTTFNPENSAISDLVSFAIEVKRETSSKEGKVAIIRKALLDHGHPAPDGATAIMRKVLPVRSDFQVIKSSLLNIQNALNQSDTADCDVELHREVRQLFHGEVNEALTDLSRSFEEIANSFSGTEQKELTKIVETIKKKSLKISEKVSGLEGFEGVQETILKVREKLDSGLDRKALEKVKKEVATATKELQSKLGPDEDFREHILAEDLEVLSLEILAQEVQLAFPSDSLLLTYEGQRKRVGSEVERIRKTFEVLPHESPQEEIAKLIQTVQVSLDDELMQQIDELGTLSKAKDMTALLAEFREQGEALTILVDKRPQFTDRDMTKRYLTHVGERLDALNEQFISQLASFPHPVQNEAQKLSTEKPANLEHLSLLFQHLKQALSTQGKVEGLNEADVKASLQLTRGFLESLEKAQKAQSPVHYEKKESVQAGKRSVVVLEKTEAKVTTLHSKMAEQASLIEKVFQNAMWTLPHVQAMLYDLAINYVMNGGVSAIDVTYALGYIALIGGALQISKRLPDQHKWLMPYVTWGLSLAYYFGKPYATEKLREAASVITKQVTNIQQLPIEASSGFALSGSAHRQDYFGHLQQASAVGNSSTTDDLLFPPEAFQLPSQPALSGVPHGELDAERLLPTFHEPKFAGPLEPIPKVPQPICPVPDPYDWGKPLTPSNVPVSPNPAPAANVEEAAKVSKSWFSFLWGK